ncbi:uncharacterized protein KQ657_003168 [Scheffersomyces spartinae]|uniref:Type 2A phosphatase activator TIP41 n=1 Tax=Scheffersomyces spartinae TaxID=45513 RepID=A0A9P7VCQ7_9ASCO|nr:uncharacterized protein KQ657_003168 [Scheffersomyces spartinae]KAG7195410.1 hypothetical protein KQ657_003168 [Scheffersomyces spartinae]
MEESNKDNNNRKQRQTFAKPFLVGSINAIEVTQAREMSRLHTIGRLPARGSKLDVKHNTSSSSTTADTSSTSSTTSTRSITSTGSSSIVSTSTDFTSTSTTPTPTVSVPAKSHQGACTNPQCNCCGQVIIPSPQAVFPIKEEPSISVNDWSIFSVKRPILNSVEIDTLNDTRFEFPLPEMIFGHSLMRIIHEPSGLHIEFNAVDALDSLESDSNLKVSYHEEWLEARKKKKEVKKDLDVLKSYDWTYSPNYKGSTSLAFIPTNDKQIPIDRLLQPDPILFFDECVLYEDELGDNGIGILSTKIRVMPTCLLLLCRFFLRIDGVIFRIRDVRIFIDLETNQVLREYKLQEMAYSEVVKLVTGKTDPKKLFRDSNWVANNILVILVTTEIATV